MTIIDVHHHPALDSLQERGGWGARQIDAVSSGNALRIFSNLSVRLAATA